MGLKGDKYPHQLISGKAVFDFECVARSHQGSQRIASPTDMSPDYGVVAKYLPLSISPSTYLNLFDPPVAFPM